MACFICLGVVNSCCGELKYANFSEINSNYSLPPVSFPAIYRASVGYLESDYCIRSIASTVDCSCV